MTATRNLGGVQVATIAANVVDWSLFVRIDFPSPTGTQRFTDRPGGFTGNIDGSSQAWTEKSFVLGAANQSRQDVLSVSWLEFDNLDYTFQSWANTPGLRDVVVKVYAGWFNGGSLEGAYAIYEGRFDDAEISQKAKITLKPHVTTWAQKILGNVLGTSCMNIFKDTATCQYVGADTTCNFSRYACNLKGNLARFNGFDLMPHPDQKITWGRVPTSG